MLYHQFHALGLVLVGIIARVTPRSRWIGVGRCVVRRRHRAVRGSIYAMTFGAPRGFGMVAPLGGVSFMLGWACVAVHAWKVSSV